MSRFDASMDRDANRQVIPSNEAFKSTKVVDFTVSGAQGALTLFTVTGAVLVNILAVCTEDLASGGAATIEVGIAASTAGLIAQTTATQIDNNEAWVDTSPGAIEALPSVKIIPTGADIIQTIATADITDGTLTYFALWRPLSSDANVVAA